MKIIDGLNQLPEPYRTQALKNYDNRHKYAEDVADCVIMAFNWGKAKQGLWYWAEFYEDLSNGVINLATPKLIDKQLDEMMCLLDSRKVMHAWQFKTARGWSDRTCRRIAKHSGGHIISGNFGYVLTTRATPEEYAEYHQRNNSQVKQTLIRLYQSEDVRNG